MAASPPGARIRLLRCFVLFHGAVRSWHWFAHDSQALFLVGALTLSACFALSLSRRGETFAIRAALPVLGVQLFATLPLTHNHFFVELYAALLLALPAPSRPESSDPVVAGLRWMTALILFQTGLQKVLYGVWFQGEFLAFMIGQSERFSSLFHLLFPAEEIARLQSHDPLQTGAGPYRVDSVVFVVVSNAVYLAEMGLAVGLLIRRSRVASAVLATLLVLMIQLGAREAGFAFLFASLLLSVLDERISRILLPVFALCELYLLGASLGWLPGGEFGRSINP